MNLPPIGQTIFGIAPVMIFLLLVLLMIPEISQGIPIKRPVSPFSHLMNNVLVNCSNYDSVFLYGDLEDQVFEVALKNLKKIQPLSGRIGNVTVRTATDLLVISLGLGESWNRTLPGAFLGINTVFVVTQELELNLANVIFVDFWLSSETNNVFVCAKSQDEKSLKIFTYNPFTDFIPAEFWRRTASKRIYYGRYFPDKTKDICSTVMFDRTKHLTNYPVQVLQRLPESWLNVLTGNYSAKLNYSNPLAADLPSVFFVLNSLVASLKVSINLIANQAEPEPFMVETMFGISEVKTVDLHMQPIVLQNTALLSTYDVSYPFKFTSDVILTHQRGLMTPLEKMFNFYGWLTIIATLIITSGAFSVIYFSNHLRLFFSIFDSLRLIVNVAIYSRMESTKSRIFFSMIFLYFLVIQATFSGHLAAFLTKPEYRVNVQGLEDLKDPRYEVIYANLAAKNYITEESLRAKTIFGEFNCNMYTVTNPKMACIERFTLVRYLISEFNLYSSKPIISRFSIFLLRKNWTLKNRANQVIMWMVDTGLQYRKFNNSGSKFSRFYNDVKEMFRENFYRPIEFSDLVFIFVLLGVGLLLGIFAFAAELAVQVWKNHQSQIRKRWRAGKRAVKILQRMLVHKFQSRLRRNSARK